MSSRIDNLLSRWLLLGILMALFAVSLACQGSAVAPTAVPPMPPEPPVAPTVAPARTATPVSNAPTPPVQAAPTSTRTLPTATAVVTGRPTYGGSLRYAYSQDFDTLDPAYQLLTPSRRVLYAIFNNLVQMMPDGTVGPELARSWDFSSDGRIVTFRLQNGVKFQDGTSLNAQAVKWNYDRFLDPSVGSPRGKELSPPLQRVETVDDQTVRFNLASAFRPLLATLTIRPGQIASPSAVQKLNSYSDRAGNFGRQPIGSGPYKLKEWISGSHVTVVRNESYWEPGMPYLDSINFYVIPDANVIFAMLRTGEVELMEELRPSDYGIAKANPNIRVVSQPGYRNKVMFVRTNVAPWDNKALRQAFAYALDRKTLVDVLYDGLAKVAYHPIASASGVWVDSTITMYDYDTTKARAKLAEAGYPNGISYVQPCSSEAFATLWCETVQVMLAKVGINMTIKPWTTASYYSDWAAGKFDAPAFSNLVVRVDPHLLLQPYIHSNGPQNYGKYKNPDFDRLIDEASGIYDVAKAKELYHKALLTMLEDSPLVFSVTEEARFALRSNVRNFAPRPDGEPRVRELWLER